MRSNQPASWGSVFAAAVGALVALAPAARAGDGGAGQRLALLDDFEPGSGYTLGDIDGQGGWQVTRRTGGATAEVVVDPADPANRLLRLRNHDGAGGGNGEIRVRKAVSPGSGPQLLTLAYDVEYAAALGNNVLWPRLYDDLDDDGDPATRYYPLVAAQHADESGLARAGHQYWAAYLPAGRPSGVQFDARPYLVRGGPRHRTAWVCFATGAGPGSHLVRIVTDNVAHPRRNAYTYDVTGDGTGIAAQAEYIDLRLASGGQATWLLDNLALAAAPAAAPHAEAGIYPDIVPGSYDGGAAAVDASASTGAVVRYEWSCLPVPRAVLAAGPEPAQIVRLPSATTTTVLLNVVAADGVYHSDTAAITVGPAAPIPRDHVQTAFGMLFGDGYGRSVSAAPLLFGRSRPPVILNQVELDVLDPGYPAGNTFHPVVDATGNLYYVTWLGRFVSFDRSLNQRWLASEPLGGWVALGPQDNNTVLVGARFVYVVGRRLASIPCVYAFDKVTGVQRWTVPLLSGGRVVEPPGHRPKAVLYDNKIYVVGAVGCLDAGGNPAPGACMIYQVDCGDDDPADPANADVGSLEAANLVHLDLAAGGTDDGSPGNVVLVPDAFGPGQHGLYWAQWSGLDQRPDMFAVRVDPAAGSATPAWGPGSADDGPALGRSHVLYSPASGVLYTPSVSTLGASLLAWDPGAAPGSERLGAVAAAGDHGAADVFVLDEFGPRPRIHAQGPAGEVWTYTDTGGDGSAFTVERRQFETAGGHFFPAGALLRAADGASVLITAVNEVPSRVVVLDLSAPPTGGTQPYECTFDLNYDFDPAAPENYGPPLDGVLVGPDGTIYAAQRKGDSACRITRLGPGTPAFCPGDMDCDGQVDFDDIDPFVTVLAGGTPCNFDNADADGSGVVDFDDIDAFVLLLATGAGCD